MSNNNRSTENLVSDGNNKIVNFKNDFDISNLNFNKSLKYLNTHRNQINNLTLPNDNNNTKSEYSPRSKKIVKRNFKSYSQNHFGSDNNLPRENKNINYSRDEPHFHLNFASISSNNSNLYNINQINNHKIYHDYDEISDLGTLKLIIKNLEHEIRDKNDEIKILNKNFKGKINLLEQENKIASEQLESKYKLNLNLMNQNYKNLINEINEENLKTKNKYEESINKIMRDYNSYRQSSISIYSHDEQINDINFKIKENEKQMKKNYDKKSKELVTHFEDPIYNILLEKLKFLGTHIDKFKEILKINFKAETNKNLFNNSNLSEIYVYFDKLKISILETDAKFLIEMNDIKINYENIYCILKNGKRDKLEELKEIIKNKFYDIERINTFVEDNYNIDQDNSAMSKNNKEEFKFNSSLLNKNKVLDNKPERELKIVHLGKGNYINYILI